MKTAVSIPDPLFNLADHAAAALGISRSELYQRALAAFLRDRPPQSLTDQMNAFVDAHPECNGLEPGWQQLQAEVLGRDPW